MPRIPILPAPDNSLPYETLQGSDWVMVPREPTAAMHRAAWKACDNDMAVGKDWSPFNAKIYAAMLSAAPACNAHDDLVAALRRQTDNMAFLLNHASTGQFYDKFTAELAEDRAAIAKATGAQS